MAAKLNRRSVILGLAAAGALPMTCFAGSGGEPAYVSCCRMPDGSYAAAVLDADARLLFHENLDARGHDAAISPDGRVAVVFARRPGRFALVLDLAARRRVTAFSAPEDRHFQGHGFFSNDGRLLFSTENDFGGERGVMGIYDAAAGYVRVGEFDCAGIGPHEALLLSDGRTVAVANGGILTHPDFPRRKLNLEAMAPSLVYLDLKTGDVIDKAALAPELHQLSIRHIAEGQGGEVWFGGQFEGAAARPVPLAGRHRRGGDIMLLDAPEDLWQSLDNYVGSVSADAARARIAMTSPRGGRMIVWDAVSGSVAERRDIRDVCGLAPREHAFLSSDGLGDLRQEGELLAHFDGIAWDNHLATLAAKSA